MSLCEHCPEVHYICLVCPSTFKEKLFEVLAIVELIKLTANIGFKTAFIRPSENFDTIYRVLFHAALVQK